MSGERRYLHTSNPNMAFASSSFGYTQPQADSTLDSKRPAFIDEHDSPAVLDPSLLDADIMQSPSNTFRKDSFANSNGVLSPADSQAWDHHHYGAALSVEPASAGASNPFHDDGHAFIRQTNGHPPSFGHQHQAPSWSFEHGSGDCTPTTAVDFMPPPPHFDAPSYQSTDGAQGSFSQPYPQAHFNVTHPEAGLTPAPQVQTPMSPHCHQDWMGMAQQEMEGRPSHKRMRPDSPPRNLIDFQRRDGIRKKNGRIDIPQERNIQTIDELIEKTTDDELLKELKQQKRLLRNREAALASRQRKKKHTEDLEIKEKGYTHQIAMLETEVNNLKVERDHRERERLVMGQRLDEAQRIIDMMQDEKRDLMMRHNEEASNLRKKVQFLTDQIEAGPAPPMSTVASSTGFTDFNAEMEALNMGPHDWDNFIMVNDLQNEAQEDFQFEPKPEPPKASRAVEKKSAPAQAQQHAKKHNDGHSDQPIASGLLFMLLLCGAFVASKPASSQPSDLPKMPANVRAAAPTILNSLLSDAAPVSHHEHTPTVARMGQEPLPSGLAYTNVRQGKMDRMHRTVTAPTKQQEIDQAFALTPAQYASMTNMDFSSYGQVHAPNPNEPAPPPRRNLAEALANLEQENGRKSKAEVYTRSLLWDQIPADVVQQFRTIVRDHNDIEARHQQQQQNNRRQSHDLTYKIEQ